MGISLSRSRVLICEGPSDVAFFKHLIEERHLPDFDVFHPNELGTIGPGNTGFGSFLSGLAVLLPSRPVTGILIASDNDLNPETSFANIRAQIQNPGGFGVPNAPLEVARSTDRPPIVVMMIPWAGVAGTLESLCLDAIYGGRADLRICLDQYCNCVGSSAWDAVRQSKMRLEALIPAICASDPATALRYAWSRPESIIPLTSPVFDQVAAFLQSFDDTCQS